MTEKTNSSTKGEFTRTIKASLLEKLKIEPLFIKHLSNDIKKGIVFPAFRKNRIDFYFKGSKLFSYNGTFKTHRKFASVIKTKTKNDYIKETDLYNASVIDDFSDGYSRIKENAKIYAGIESTYVAGIYHNSSYASKHNNDIVVLDIEASFDGDESGDSSNRKDRIDLVLFDKRNSKLYFIEAKHYSNNEIWSTIGVQPTVIQQLIRYDKQLVNRKIQILNAYSNYINYANILFDNNFPTPSQIEMQTILFIFGYDRRQGKKLSEYLIKDGSLVGHKYRFIGNPESAAQILVNIKTG